MKYLNINLPLLILAFLLLGMPACVENYDIESTETVKPPPKELTNTHVYGKVVGEYNSVLQGAEVSLYTVNGTETTTTDQKGYFEFPDVRVVGKSAFVKVEHPGKFDGFRRWSTIKNKWNYTVIKMLDKEIVGTINAGTGGTVQTEQGAKLELPANAVVKKNGAPYNGIISVAMQWINPAANDLMQRIVGDLSGIDNEGREVALGTFGMMVVELLDNAGNELEIKDGQTAQLTYPIPDNFDVDLPQTVPMWSFDEELGTWIEETVASLKNDEYVADVSHFSAWNVDWKGPSIELSGKVTVDGQTGSILTSYQVFVSSPVFGQRGGYLTPDGEFLFYRFPADETFTLSIVNACGIEVHEETYGPFNQNTDLGTIDISSGTMDYLTISGTATDCNDDPVPGALVHMEYDSLSLYVGEADMNGEFDIIVPYCGITVNATLTIIDVGNKKSSMPQNFVLDGNDVDLGEVKACDEPEEFIGFTFDQTTDYFFTSPPDFITLTKNNPSQDSRLIYEGGHGYLQITTDNEITGTGTYNSSDHYFSIRDAGAIYFGTPTSPPDMTVEITQYSDIPGEVIRGTFVGTVIDSLQATVPIDGEFKVKVD